MRIEHEIRPGGEWDEFAESQSEARLGHASAWSSVLEEAYGLDPHYLCARDDHGSLRGILPLVVFRSRPAGPRRLISLPYLDGSGILALDAETAEQLLELPDDPIDLLLLDRAPQSSEDHAILVVSELANDAYSQGS